MNKLRKRSLAAVCTGVLFAGGFAGTARSEGHDKTVTVLPGTAMEVVFSAPAADQWNWRLTVNAGGGWCHAPETQRPNSMPWVPRDFSGTSGYWSVPASDDAPERHFQITFDGKLRGCSGEGGPGGRGGSGRYVAPEWVVTGKTDSAYFVIPGYIVSSVNQDVTLQALNHLAHPVSSAWLVSPLNGVTPAIMTPGPTMTFQSAEPGDYIVTGTSLTDPQMTDSALVTILLDDAEEITVCGPIDGFLGINPNNNPYASFILKLPDGTVIERSDLMALFPGYSGPASWVRLQPKGGGHQNTLNLNGEPLPIKNSETYKLSSDIMTVHLYNDHVNEKGLAMGQWFIAFEALDACIEMVNYSNR